MGGGGRRAAGFTLIEILVVLAILGVLAVVALPRLSLGTGQGLRAAAERLAAELRLLREEALRRSVATSLRSTAGGYVLEPSGRAEPLPAGTVLTARPDAPPLLPDEAGQAFAFFPDGSSTGGTVRLQRGRGVVEVGVRGIDGRVRLRE